MQRCAATRWVTHERLDDEVIAINLETGAYFALDDSAADCWTLVLSGATTDEVVAVLSRRYAAEPLQIRADIERFVGELLEAGLVEPLESAPPLPPAEGLLPGVDQPLAYTAPTVDKFEDLQELLLLDPIHEVDEAGWPVARVD